MHNVYIIHAAIAITLASSSCVYAEDIKYSVIHTPNYNIKINQHYSSHKMGLRIQGNNKIYPLNNRNTLDRLVYTGEAPRTTQPYQYVILDNEDKVLESEPFYRSTSRTAVYEFYRRPTTIKKFNADHGLLRVKYSYKDANEDHRYSEGLDRSQVHPKDEIPTIHIQSNPVDIRALHDRVLDDVGITANISRISANNIEQFTNVKIELSGQTSRLFRKLSYSVNIDKSTPNALNGYRKFKLRSCATDPSYLREKLFYDVLAASEVPSAKSSFIRLFINEEPQGLYLIVDHYKNPFLKNVFGNGDTEYKQGALYQGSMQENPLAIGHLQLGANLGYLGPQPTDYIESVSNASVYKVQELGHGDKPKDGLNNLISFLDFIYQTEGYDIKKKKDKKKLAQEWNKKFDVSLFLKHMVFEILMGHNDGYMGAAHNYMLYQDPTQQDRFVWLASDLDQTLGSTLLAPRSSPPDSALEKLDRYALLDKIESRPLVHQILKVDRFSKQFFQIFKDLHHSLFKSQALTMHLANLKKMIAEDVEWDKQLDEYRVDNFANNQTVYNNQLNQKVLQMPLGQDFFERIGKIGFDAALDGPIYHHPSLISLTDWFKETENLLEEFVTSVEFEDLI